MNKLILCLFVALTASMINVRWSTASLDTFYDDFVSYPSLKVKRDLEFEEFLKDGNMKEAKKRAFHRQKRANEENMSDILKRARRNLAEAEDEDEDDDIHKRCSAEEYNGIERDTCFECTTFGQAIKYVFSEKFPCSTYTKDRVKEMMASYTERSECDFETNEMSDENHADIKIQCDISDGNYAPLGKSSYKIINLQEVNGNPKRAGYRIIAHELGHACCLQHTQKLPGREKLQSVHLECVMDGMEDQFTVNGCTNPCSKFSSEYPITMVNVASLMQYKADAFSKGCPTIEPKRLSNTLLNARKLPWLSDFILIQEAYCVDCKSDRPLDDDEVFGKDCSILSIKAVLDAGEITVVNSEMCMNPQEITLSAGSSIKLKCQPTSSHLSISELRWSGLEQQSICKNGAMRLMARIDERFGEVAIVCGEGTDAVEYVLDCTEDLLVLEGLSADTGELTVKATAC